MQANPIVPSGTNLEQSDAAHSITLANVVTTPAYVPATVAYHRDFVARGFQGLPGIPSAGGYKDMRGLPGIPSAGGYKDMGHVPEIPGGPGSLIYWGALFAGGWFLWKWLNNDL